MKKLSRVLLVVFLIIAVIGVVGVLSIDVIAKHGLETGATQALGTDTSVAELDVGIGAGACTLRRLEIENPEGFVSENFLALEDGVVQVSLRSLLGEKVVVPRLTLSGVDVTLERKGGKSNYAVILENVKKLGSGEKPRTEDPGEAKQYVIEEVDIEKIRVHVDMLPEGGELARARLDIPGIHLRDVGSDADRGLLLTEVCAVLVKSILQAVVKKGAGELSSELLEDLEGGLAQVEIFGDLGVEILEEVSGAVRGAAGETGKAVEEAGDAVQRGAEEVIEGVQDVLDDKEPEEPEEEKKEIDQEPEEKKTENPSGHGEQGPS